jgi:DNA topoisomerase 2-associated protein PAT1
MSFFGFKQGDLEQDKFNYKKGNADDVAVYTFGEEGYDGLGDLLQEGGDELNDETFGRVGSIGEGILLQFIKRPAQGSGFPS